MGVPDVTYEEFSQCCFVYFGIPDHEGCPADLENFDFRARLGVGVGGSISFPNQTLRSASELYLGPYRLPKAMLKEDKGSSSSFLTFTQRA